MTTMAARAAQSGLDPRVARSRTAIMKATIELIAEVGFAGCTIDAVVRRTGVARATIYRHWPSREALLKSAIDTLSAVGHLRDTGSLRGDVVEFFTKAYPGEDSVFTQSLHSLLGIFDAARHDAGFAEVTAKFTTELLKHLEIVLERARRRGELAPEGDLSAMANLLLGAVVIRQGFHNQRLSETYLLQVLEALLTGFRD
jgi:AcrR family transcriptional regulator